MGEINFSIATLPLSTVQPGTCPAFSAPVYSRLSEEIFIRGDAKAIQLGSEENSGWEEQN